MSTILKGPLSREETEQKLRGFSGRFIVYHSACGFLMRNHPIWGFLRWLHLDCPKYARDLPIDSYPQGGRHE